MTSFINTYCAECGKKISVNFKNRNEISLCKDCKKSRSISDSRKKHNRQMGYIHE